ncbi:SDR family oxidoreductase [Kitasatospora purpeofusca]|uniref:SDR family oxidoreductase n=1 Tax=Kitasatospora purpeofusca TaxID=67352 RepID=UPI002E153582|nr:SDR family oxidoreductase [Kitasatospora purpeofusca]WSR38000.1 SDR family oxidoreductase [Kitasatospora purpeofusca]
MSRSSKARTAIVTGASKGLGAGIAKALAEAGAAVVVNYREDAEGAERVVAGITAEGGRAVAVRADVARGEDVRRLFDRAREEFGPVEVLVNNAGVATFAPLSGITEEEFQRQMSTNLLGTILTTQALAIAGTPLGRTGTPDDYGPLVAFLASDDARWITGDVILASGGMR